jgi:membrane protein YqaA with SNARE-associated domain
MKELIESNFLPFPSEVSQIQFEVESENFNGVTKAMTLYFGSLVGSMPSEAKRRRKQKKMKKRRTEKH